MKNKLLVVGTMAYDAIETPFDKVDRILGGAATYIALASSKFDVDCGLVSVIGADFEESDLKILQDLDVDISGVELVPDGKSFFWSGRYHDNMNMRTTLDTQLNVLENFNPIVPSSYKSAEVMMIGNLHPGVQLSALNQMEGKPKFVVLDTMNFWMDHFRSTLDEVIAKVDLITINDEEARQLSEEHSLVKAAEKIHAMGPKYVIIKKGEHGAMLFGDGKIFIAPAFPLDQVIDPTGAGDSFAGGISGILANTDAINFETLKSGIIYGSVLASFTVEQFGVKALLAVTSEAINDRIEKFKSLTSFEWNDK
jgi:sugar/nucleoside kinase (ribokinase family)|tara:strand:- start:1662 stop:2591 length:930 start_codon:yes stop_codon:yes gene_type:complete